jgi:hypothetical protein
MTIGKYLRLVLAADAAVALLVENRVFTEVLPQLPQVPALVFNEVGGDDEYNLRGPTTTRSRQLQIDSWGKDRADATALSIFVRGVLSGHRGAAAGLEVEELTLTAERWDYDPEVKLYRTSQDYEVWFSGTES